MLAKIDRKSSVDQEYRSEPLSPREQWAEGYRVTGRAMRDAGRWALGVVAGLLLAATNLSGFGRLYPNKWRFWIAIISAVATVGTVGRIVYIFLQMQINQELDWEKLTPTQFAMVQDYGFLKDYASFQDFHDHQQQTKEAYGKIRASIGATPLVFPEQHNHKLLNQQNILSDKLADMVWQRQAVQALLGYAPVKEQFDRARGSLLHLGIVAAIATMSLVWAVNGPEPRSQTIVVISPAATPALEPAEIGIP